MPALAGGADDQSHGLRPDSVRRVQTRSHSFRHGHPVLGDGWLLQAGDCFVEYFFVCVG